MVLVALPLFDHVLVVLKFLAGQLDKAYVHSWKEEKNELGYSGY